MLRKWPGAHTLLSFTADVSQFSHSIINNDLRCKYETDKKSQLGPL